MAKARVFIPPSFEEFMEYCVENGYGNIAKRVFDGYAVADWHDSHGNKIKNWKQKLIHVWFKDDNKDKTSLTKATKMDGFVDSSRRAQEMLDKIYKKND